MRQIFSILLISFCACALLARNNETEPSDLQGDSLSIQGVIDACISMREAAAAGDSAALCQAARDLRAAGTSDFHFLRCSDDSIPSLNGHLVFTDVFADSLANDSTAYETADEITRSSTHRGQTTNGSYLTKTLMVKGNQSARYTFPSKGYQELAVVAEAGGRVTMKIHVTNSAGLDRRYDDTKSVKKGLPQRKTAFELPSDRRNTVELEVVNCGDKDCSVVVISN